MGGSISAFWANAPTTGAAAFCFFKFFFEFASSLPAKALAKSRPVESGFNLMALNLNCHIRKGFNSFH